MGGRRLAQALNYGWLRGGDRELKVNGLGWYEEKWKGRACKLVLSLGKTGLGLSLRRAEGLYLVFTASLDHHQSLLAYCRYF